MAIEVTRTTNNLPDHFKQLLRAGDIRSLKEIVTWPFKAVPSVQEEQVSTVEELTKDALGRAFVIYVNQDLNNQDLENLVKSPDFFVTDELVELILQSEENMNSRAAQLLFKHHTLNIERYPEIVDAVFDNPNLLIIYAINNPSWKISEYQITRVAATLTQNQERIPVAINLLLKKFQSSDLQKLLLKMKTFGAKESSPNYCAIESIINGIPVEDALRDRLDPLIESVVDRRLPGFTKV